MNWYLLLIPASIVAVMFVGFAIIVPAFVQWQQRRTDRLQGEDPERYFRTVEDLGNEEGERALNESDEDELTARLHPVSAGEAQGFRHRWDTVLAQFQDDPADAVDAADRLVTEILAARGIVSLEPAGARAAHLHSLDHYERAHATAGRSHNPGTPFADLQQAIHQYRVAVDELI